MGRFKTIQYAYNVHSGMCISRVGSNIACPVLEYDKMQPENNFETSYKLEKMSVHAISQVWDEYKWTRKIPFHVKNMHRKFWGMPELKRRPNSHEMTATWEGLKFRHAGHTFTLVKVKPDASNPDFDAVELKDEKKRRTEWNFGGMVEYLRENPESVEHATMGLIRETQKSEV